MNCPQRNLSGYYFRYKNPTTGGWENWCFEDLPEEERKKILAKNNKEFSINLCMGLSKCLRELGDVVELWRE